MKEAIEVQNFSDAAQDILSYVTELEDKVEELEEENNDLQAQIDELKSKQAHMQEPCHLCGNPSTINWLGKGLMCQPCFKIEYKKINKDEPEERQEKIKGNFEKRV